MTAAAAPAAIFDLDGTLIDSRADLATAVNATRADYGLPPLPAALVATFVGEGMRTLLARAMPEHAEFIDEAVPRARAHYGAHLLDQTRLYPGVVDALARLCAGGFRLAVVSNKPYEFIPPTLSGLGIDGFFGACIGGGPDLPLKPDPAPLLAALRALGADLAGSWIVGDHFTDLEAGRRAGLRRCFCRYGFGDPRDEPFDLAVDRPAELTQLLGGTVAKQVR
jgi:phosphoglycolate phosphatase